VSAIERITSVVPPLLFADGRQPALTAHRTLLVTRRPVCPCLLVGPLVGAAQLDNVRELVADATARGARVVVGGEQLGRPGHFLAPTVIADVPPDAALLHEEIFGPVAPVVAVEDEDDAVRRANATPYGLAAYVYTAEMARALRVMRRLETGMVGINQGTISSAAAPFGGLNSGIGREGGAEGIDEYLATQCAAFEHGGDPCST